MPDFAGPFVQGPSGERFVYIDIGTYAGQTNTPWARRLKIPLGGITWEMVKARAGLLARVPGTGADGSPSCAYAWRKSNPSWQWQVDTAEELMARAIYKRAAPYADDAMNLPVADVDAAIPFYEATFGFRVVSQQASPIKSVILVRDDVKIGLAENGGDPTQEGCFFEVDNAHAAFEEIKGLPATDSDFRIDKFGDVSYRVFFVVAPDGLCFMLGERQ